MRTLSGLDYMIVAIFLVAAAGIGFFFTRRAGKSTNHFFLGARSMPWWLLGTSMAATNASTDTPLAIMKYVYQEGIAGAWFFWAAAIQVCLATFLFSQLWRRSEVMTDVEIVEKRYGGRPARILRVLKGVYFGVVLNSAIMGWVYKGLIKTLTGMTTLNTMQVVIGATGIVALYTIASGFYGVIWTEFFQYFIEIVACIALSYFAITAAGGAHHMMETLQQQYGGGGLLQMYPHWPQADQWMPLSVFFTYIGIQWWAHKFADGGGKHIQRMSSAKSEKDAILGTFYFSFMNFVFRMWPWIIVALASLVIFGRDLKDPEMAYPMMIARVTPNGWFGLMIVVTLYAFMCSAATHTNLGASYLVNDLYRRFIKKDGSERHYMVASRLATMLSLAMAITVACNMQSVGSAWKVMAEMTSGAGITWILRWFWWRINAWTEIAALLTSIAVTITIELTNPTMLYSYKLWTIISISMVVWLTVTFLTPAVDDTILRDFVAKVGPAKFGWGRIYRKYNLTTDFTLRTSLMSWLIGLLFLFCLNFGVGNIVLLNTLVGSVQIAVSGVLFIVLLRRIIAQTAPDTARRAALQQTPKIPS